MLILGVAGCAAPATTAPVEQTASTEPEEAVVQAATPVSSTEDSASVAPSASTASSKKKAVSKRSARKAKKSEDSDPPALGASMMLGTVGDSEEVTIRCVVRLPEDSTDHPELCRNFRIILLDDHKNEVARFRFDGEGIHRFKAASGKTYRLKPLIGSNWKFEIEPRENLKAGDLAKAVFTQKE